MTLALAAAEKNTNSATVNKYFKHTINQWVTGFGDPFFVT